MEFNLVGLFTAGLLTFASPCILPLAPIYLAMLGGASMSELAAGSRVPRTVVAAGAFSLGIALVFVLLGMAATTLGRALVAHRPLLLQLGGLAVFLFGLKTLGVLHLPWLDRDVRPMLTRARGGSALASFVMGVAFGLGWTPCIGPVLGSVLTFTATTTTNPLEGAGYLAVYAAGLALPLVGAAFVAPVALAWFKRAQRWLRPLQLATGGVLAVVGLLLITDNLSALTPSGAEADRIAPTARVVEHTAASDPAVAAACAQESSGEGACSLPTEPGAAPAIPAVIAAGPAMVEFVGRACPICQRMAPVVDEVERACAGREVRIQRIEVDGQDGRALARRHGVIGVPTFLFIDDDGTELARLVGEQPLPSLQQPLHLLTGQQCDGFRVLPPG